eukprot:1159098-Pelagomonas_calceolata.AAC.16
MAVECRSDRDVQECPAVRCKSGSEEQERPAVKWGAAPRWKAQGYSKQVSTQMSSQLSFWS